MIKLRAYVALVLGLLFGPYLSSIPAFYGVAIWIVIAAYGLIGFARELGR